MNSHISREVKIPFCEKLHNYRTENHITRKELAKEMIRVNGKNPRDDLMLVSATVERIRLYEKGQCPKVQDLKTLSVVMEMSLEELFQYF